MMAFLTCQAIMVNLLPVCKCLQVTKIYIFSDGLENHFKGEIT